MRSHARLQNALAAHAAQQGFDVKAPAASDPLWDVLWMDGDTAWIAEVKSITDNNEERQLRLGLGQLLQYRHRLTVAGVSARAVLAVERKPSDPLWQELCDDLDVVLVWPAVLELRIRA